MWDHLDSDGGSADLLLSRLVQRFVAVNGSFGQTRESCVTVLEKILNTLLTATAHIIIIWHLGEVISGVDETEVDRGIRLKTAVEGTKGCG